MRFCYPDMTQVLIPKQQLRHRPATHLPATFILQFVGALVVLILIFDFKKKKARKFELRSLQFPIDDLTT